MNGYGEVYATFPYESGDTVLLLATILTLWSVAALVTAPIVGRWLKSKQRVACVTCGVAHE